MPADEGARPAEAGHQDHQRQPPQVHVPEQKLAFQVSQNNTIWSYELQPTATGTRVIESRHAENGVKPFSNLMIGTLFGGVPGFERELVDGMNDSLARIKAAAETG